MTDSVRDRNPSLIAYWPHSKAALAISGHVAGAEVRETHIDEE